MAGRSLSFSRAEFAAAWNDPQLTRAEIAERFGMSELHTWRVAKRFGLPPRKIGPRLKRVPDAFIRAAWLAGVSAGEICEAAGIVPDTLYARLEPLGLSRRGPGARPKMTLAEFRAVLLRARLGRAAREEQAALLNAEMVDGRQDARWHRRAA